MEPLYSLIVDVCVKLLMNPVWSTCDGKWIIMALTSDNGKTIHSREPDESREIEQNIARANDINHDTITSMTERVLYIIL